MVCYIVKASFVRKNFIGQEDGNSVAFQRRTLYKNLPSHRHCRNINPNVNFPADTIIARGLALRSRNGIFIGR